MKSQGKEVKRDAYRNTPTRIGSRESTGGWAALGAKNSLRPMRHDWKKDRVDPGSILVLGGCVPDVVGPLSTRGSYCKNESEVNALPEGVDTLERSTQ